MPRELGQRCASAHDERHPRPPAGGPGAPGLSAARARRRARPGSRGRSTRSRRRPSPASPPRTSRPPTSCSAAPSCTSIPATCSGAACRRGSPISTSPRSRSAGPWSIAAMPASSTASSDLLVEMARDHAIGGKPIYVTGHSAGGALATLAARRLHEAGARGPGGGGVLRPARRRPALRRELPRAAPAHRAPARPDPASAAAALARRASSGRGVIDPLIEAVGVAVAAAVGRPGRRGPSMSMPASCSTTTGRPRSIASRPATICAGSGRSCCASCSPTCCGRGAPPDAAAYRAAACPRWATPVPARLMDGVRLPATLAQIGRQVRAAPARLPARPPYRRCVWPSSTGSSARPAEPVASSLHASGGSILGSGEAPP